LLAEPKLDDPRLIRVQLQAEPFHDDAEAAQRLLRLCLASTEHDGVVRVPHQLPQITPPCGLPSSAPSTRPSTITPA
jgi:hypothetical protein